MRRKLAGYTLLSFLSFCFFTSIFHAVANAQAADPSLASAKSQVGEGKHIPTPTLFNAEPTLAPKPTEIKPQKPLPTPTVYASQKQVVADETSISETPKPKTKTETVVAMPTTTPEPTETPEPTATPTPQPTIAVATDLESLFNAYSSQYNVDKELLKKIARCESGFNPTSNNSGLYLGMFQFSARTWSAARGRMGLDPNPDLRTNPEEAIKTAAYVISTSGDGAWPNCH